VKRREFITLVGGVAARGEQHGAEELVVKRES
jgi:hypothetical protein